MNQKNQIINFASMHASLTLEEKIRRAMEMDSDSDDIGSQDSEEAFDLIEGSLTGGSLILEPSSELEKQSEDMNSLKHTPRSKSARESLYSLSGLSMNSLDFHDNPDAVQNIVHRLVEELRNVKSERDMLKLNTEDKVKEAIANTKKQLDNDFRLVVRALVDDKERSLRQLNMELEKCKLKTTIETNRCGMALSELESLTFNTSDNSSIRLCDSVGSSINYIFDQGHSASGNAERVTSIIFESLSSGDSVPVSRIRSFLRQSDILPPGMRHAELDVLLSKHIKRNLNVTKQEFELVLADIALGLIQSGMISVPEKLRNECEPRVDTWGVLTPQTCISKSTALRALGRVLFPTNQ